MIDTNFVRSFAVYWIFIGLVLFPVLFFVKQPYGRHMRKGWGPTIQNNTAWLIMELPALMVFILAVYCTDNISGFVIFAASLWILHYVHRTLIFPFRLKTRGKKMPLVIVVSGICFNFVNASLNGIVLSNNDPGIDSQPDKFRIIAGLTLFVSGMCINIISDNYLIHLRKNSTNGYQIPHKYLFKWISCPNFFGEIIEWAGFAILAFNPAALSFLVWTIVNLVPRAMNHHIWYKRTFAEYPVNRKALIPFIL